MLARIRRLPSPALVISAIALIVAVGGGSFAIAAINNSKVKKIAKKQANKQIKKKAPGLSVSHAATADTATNANHATSADSAANADHASSADTATNASQLGGQPASDYRLHCPSGMNRAADLCFEPSLRAGADYATALHTCALAQRRLPDDGELALVFGHLAPNQQFQWTASHYFGSSGPAVAPMLSDDNSYNIVFNAALVTASHPYLCVTSASN